MWRRISLTANDPPHVRHCWNSSLTFIFIGKGMLFCKGRKYIRPVPKQRSCSVLQLPWHTVLSSFLFFSLVNKIWKPPVSFNWGYDLKQIQTNLINYQFRNFRNYQLCNELQIEAVFYVIYKSFIQFRSSLNLTIFQPTHSQSRKFMSWLPILLTPYRYLIYTR
jgi:hypothetical protein